jgi:hypothetical protein
LIVTTVAFAALIGVTSPQCAEASPTVCVHLDGIKICRTPVTNGARVCTTVNVGGVSVTRCRFQPNAPSHPVHHKASYYLPRGQAQNDTRDRLHYRGYTSVGASCVLPGGQQPSPGYDYHTWKCGFVTSTRPFGPITCSGHYLVSGADKAGVFYTTLEDSAGVCPHGA